MSMILCDRCDWAIDSDDDPECFVQIIETGPDGEHRHEEVLCEPCREKTLIHHEEEA